jgi:hypothetical protein
VGWGLVSGVWRLASGVVAPGVGCGEAVRGRGLAGEWQCALCVVVGLAMVLLIRTVRIACAGAARRSMAGQDRQRGKAHPSQHETPRRETSARFLPKAKRSHTTFPWLCTFHHYNNKSTTTTIERL